MHSQCIWCHYKSFANHCQSSIMSMENKTGRFIRKFVNINKNWHFDWSNYHHVTASLWSLKIGERVPLIRTMLRTLHWLPIRARIQFNILLLVFKSKNGSASVYISELLPSYDPGRSWRSRDKCLLIIPRYRLEAYGGRSFLVHAARLWNKLGDELRKGKTVSIFSRGLKTHLFRRCL
jgi:hypothetical protein